MTKISIRNAISQLQYQVSESWKYDLNRYVNNIPIIRQLMNGKEINISCPVTFIVGENGTGKSTLLEAIAVHFGLNGEGGDQYSDFSTKRDYSDLYRLIMFEQRTEPKDGFFLRAESFYNLATDVDRNDLIKLYGGTSLHQMSHGESFMALVKNRFKANGLYILDEPEAALSPSRVLELMKEIKRLTSMGSQFIIATHSPILITYPDAQIYDCSQQGLYERAYYELESFNVVKDFLNNPEYSLRCIGL